MAFISELREHVEALAARGEFDVDASLLAARMDAADDAVVLGVLRDAAALANCVERLRVVAAGVAERRSRRDRGHGGLAAGQGHRSPSELIQSVTGVTRAEADRQVRQGRALLDAADEAAASTEGGAGVSDVGSGDAAGAEDAPSADDDGAVDDGAVGGRASAHTVPHRWDDALQRALLDGSLTPARHDAIFRGLGAPPIRDDRDRDAVVQAWSLAAAQLCGEAERFTPYELLRRARQVRDALDPVGAEERFRNRFEQRSFRMWADQDGQFHARIAFDDEMAAWVRSMVDAALRPRRGGPRFVDDEQARQARSLAEDPRSNDQLAYDLILGTLRAGALADAESVFGARQPGVRMVVVKDAEGESGPTGPRDAFGRMIATGHLEDGGDAIPGTVLDRALCDTGHRDITVDAQGNPLDVGREQRLFTPKQRIALAIRDGGCLWPGCHVPASYCEAHHCDHWHEHGGRTDCDRGVLLCRFHHLTLHNNGWRITRDGQGPFVLHPPPGQGESITLLSKSAIRWAWNPPPPPPERPGWRTRPSLPVTRDTPTTGRQRPNSAIQDLAPRDAAAALDRDGEPAALALGSRDAVAATGRTPAGCSARVDAVTGPYRPGVPERARPAVRKWHRSDDRRATR